MRFRLGIAILSSILAGRALAEAPATDFVLPSGEVVAGERLGALRTMATQANRVRLAVQQAFGVDVAQVPIHVVTLDGIRALHAEIGGRLRSGWELHGFELDGHVFVRRELGGVSDEVLIHECLHAVSQRFAHDAHALGLDRVVEGVTQYLALRALAARPPSPGLRAERNRTYVASTAFADALASLVGAEALQAAYFGAGLRALAARVDSMRHGRTLLVRAARALDEGDERAALSLLTGAR